MLPRLEISPSHAPAAGPGLPSSVPAHLAGLGLDGDPDLPHDGAGMEWWYVNLHLTTESGRRISAFASFFRIGERRPDGSTAYSHTLAAAWSDAQARRYTQMTRIDEANLALIRSTLHHDQAYAPRLREALQQLLSDKHPPLPDLPLEGPVAFTSSPFTVDYGPEARLRRDAGGRYHLHLRHPEEGHGLDCVLTPSRPAAWQGENGEVAGLGDDEEGMRYYSVTRLTATGSVTLDGVRHSIAEGSAWYDHEWGLDLIRADKGYTRHEAEWDWCGLHLDNGYDLSASTLRKVDCREGTSQIVDRALLLVAPDGTAGPVADWTLEPKGYWTSLATCNRYPVAWRLTAPSRGVDLSLEAVFPEQEVRSITVHRGFWEGRVTISGVFEGRPVGGTGFVEVKPAQVMSRLDAVMETIAAETRAQAEAFYPADPGPETTSGFIEPVSPDLVAALPHGQLHRALAAPVRHTVEGMGKSWRSFALVAVLESLGVSSDPYRPLMAAVELLHAGSLIIDDVQDEAQLRRGRPAAHILYGEATAINAGTAAYFAFDRVLRQLTLDPADRLRAYEVLCAVLRGAHAGQALDIAGTSGGAQFPERDARALGEQVLAVHRLKTALPVRALGEIGAVLGHATPAQESALCDYLEAIGLAYQIADDVFDLRGHRSSEGHILKEPGEDIRNGRITYPLTCALELLPEREGRQLWDRVQARPVEPAEVSSCIAALIECGAVELALARAQQQLDEKWSALEPLLPNYPIVAVLRSLGFYAVTRDAELNG